MPLNTTEELIEDIRQGKMVILMDDEDRENEGDLVMAAECVTPEAINFMATHGRGLICLSLTQEKCEQLNLPLMVDNNNAQFSTNFTVSIEAAEGVTTGISAADRARTVQAAVALDAKAADLVQPGHIFPLKAKDGGILVRAGHTEASVDLARMAGFQAAGVIVEILKDDGEMARRPDLEVFAEKHNIKIGTIAQLIEYRNVKEKSVEKVASCKLPTQFGEFQLHTYKDVIDEKLHFAMVKGDINADEPTLVRVHLENTFTDVLHSERAVSRSFDLPTAMKKVSEEGGVVLILANQDDNESIISRVQAFEAEDKGEKPSPAKWTGTSRNVGVGSQILADLGIGKMRLLSAPKKYHALSGFHLEVVEYVEA